MKSVKWKTALQIVLWNGNLLRQMIQIEGWVSTFADFYWPLYILKFSTAVLALNSCSFFRLKMRFTDISSIDGGNRSTGRSTWKLCSYCLYNYTDLCLSTYTTSSFVGAFIHHTDLSSSIMWLYGKPTTFS